MEDIMRKTSNHCIGRVIVVDDEVELMNALCEALTKQGYETEGFLTGAEALAALRDREFDLLLTDMMMPGLNGVELIRAGLDIDPNLIGIIMTGHGTVQSAVEAMKIGAFDYILKPFKLNTIMPLLSRAMQVRNLRLENMQLKETVAIHELGKAISFSSDLNSILNKIADTALQQCSADEVSIMLPTKSGRELYVAVVRGGQTENLGEHAPIEQGIAGWVARNRESVVLKGEVDDPRMKPIRPRGDIYIAVSMPMLSQGKVVGVLNVNITKSHRRFTLGQLKALSILVSIIGPILENASLYILIRKAEEEYSSIFENTGQGIYRSMPAGGFLIANPALARIFGYDSPEELMASVTDIKEQIYVNPADAAEFARIMELKGAIGNFECQAYRKDASRIWLSIWAHTVRDEKGALIYYEGILEDITVHKQAEAEKRSLEERLQRAEKMEALGQLAGRVAHDLNNVLGVLIGYSELLLMEIPQGERARGYVETIVQSTEKGAAIIQDLLTLARRGVAVADVINISDIIEGFLKTPVFEKIKGDSPRVTFHAECGRELLNIKGSALHLEKTVMNLVSNAVEAISGTGEVTIRTENRYLDRAIKGYDEIREGDYVVLRVSDTGMGIPAENIGKIFEPFFSKKTMGRSGTGLGLAIVWGTVKDHNGYIDVESTVDEGTTFTLYFPVTREEMAAQQQASLESYLGKGEAVLVVDDIADQREVATRLLAKLGYQVQAVASGEEAVEYLMGNRADILVLDMIMAPGIDGLETWRRVRKINPEQKAIIVSGFSETERVREAQNLGAGAYVKKPYILEKIGVAIRTELNRKQTPAPL